MTPAELLEATKVEVGLRWVQGASLWSDYEPAASCILGCLGFARWGEEFKRGYQTGGYTRLEGDAVARDAVVALAQHASEHVLEEFGDHLSTAEPMQLVYRQNDRHFGTKQDANDFIDLALADLQAA